MQSEDRGSDLVEGAGRRLILSGGWNNAANDEFILRDFVEFHCFGAFLVVATVDSSFQELEWFGNSVARFPMIAIMMLMFFPICISV